jgi:HPt (histidine-containing phosphotransfer) domain-containing protein
MEDCDTSDGEIFAEHIFRKRLMGDDKLVKTIIEAFLYDIPCQIDALRSSIEAKDASQAERLAHRIKGAAGNVAAIGLQKAAHEMEQAALAGDMKELEEKMDRLHRQFAHLKQAMAQVGKT